MRRRIILFLVTALVALVLAATPGFAQERPPTGNERGCEGILTASLHNRHSLIETFPGGPDVPATQLCDFVVVPE